MSSVSIARSVTAWVRVAVGEGRTRFTIPALSDYELVTLEK